MKKNLFLMLSLWISGAASVSAQTGGYYPAPGHYPQGRYPGAPGFAPIAQPAGYYPSYMGPATQRSYGLEPYPDQMPRPGVASVNPRPAAPAIGAAPVGGVIPASATSTTPTFPNWLPPADAKGAPGVSKSAGLPETESTGKGFLPPPPTGLAPAPTDPPEPSEKLDVAPRPVVPSGESCAGGECGPICAVLSPGEPIMAQLIDSTTSTRGRNWFLSVDYLHWWMRDQKDVPGLGATNGQGGATADPDNGERSGVRAHLGKWLSDRVAIEGDFLILGDRSPSSVVSSGPSAVTQLPFFAGIDGMTRTIQAPTSFWQQELGLRYKVCGNPCWHVDFLAGARYLEFDEALTIRSGTSFTQAPVLLSSAVVTTVDRFSADNRFLGANVGLDAEYESGWFFLQANLKLGFGNNRQRVTIDGSTVVVAPPAPLGNQTIPGTGTFATPSNNGVYARDRFTLIPEAAIFTGVKFHDCVRLGVGYNFLFITDVVRPSNQIDPTAGNGLPLSFLGPPFTTGQPAFPFASSTFWAQGVSVRLEIRY